MPAYKRHLPYQSSAVMKCCRVCHQTKHISAFTRTVLNYCQSICNTCSPELRVDNNRTFYVCFLGVEKKSVHDSESPRSCYSECETFQSSTAHPFVDPCAKWVTVKCFGNTCDPSDRIVVAKVVN